MPTRAMILLALVVLPAAAQETGPRLEPAAVSASGRQPALLTVPRFGRYSVKIASAQGVALEIVDRMAGPLSSAGVAGESDGRLDLFLERGEYRVFSQGHAQASGQARLAVAAFVEKNAPEPVLVEGRPVAAALDDLEQLSWWLSIEQPRRVVLEAAGRNLSDLRLWRDGSWLVDVEPESARGEPRTGQPLRVRRFSAALEPGLYRVSAYGGPPEAWAEESPEHPLHLRFGIPRLPVAGRRRLEMSPFGIDRFLVSARANYFRLELPEALAASMTVSGLDANAPFSTSGTLREITKASSPPVAEVELAPVAWDAPDAHVGDRVVTVSALAGQAYVLQQFEARDAYPLRADGEHWLSTVHSGHPQDSVDVTALLTRSSDRAPVAADVLPLSSERGFSRRANLQGRLTLFLDVEEAGAYEVVGEGVSASYRIEPFLTTRPEGYRSPAAQPSGAVFELEAGFHELSVEPAERGIVTLRVRPRAVLTRVLDAVGVTDSAAPRPVRAAARFTKLVFDRQHVYTLHLNRQPEVRAGAILRRLPIDLAEPLFVSQQPGETVAFPAHLAEAGTLRAEAEDGTALEISVDGLTPARSPTVAAGTHTLSVLHRGPGIVQYSLVWLPDRLSAETPLPALAPTERPAEFPVLAEDQPRHLDLAAGRSATFEVRAGRPGLYQLESTGLLATEGNLRGRVATSYARESRNGVGRNFQIRQYLREGDYQLTLATVAPSAGRLGVALARTAIADGGFLTSRLPARTSLRAGEGVAYRFTITKPGTFRVRALGLGRSLRCRLEDRDGWPVVPPNAPADVTRYFEPGRYRFLVLPEATDARVISWIEPVVNPRLRAGHGPHPLSLGRGVDHVWLESPEGEARQPDVWELTVPVRVDARVTLTGEMRADVVRVEQTGLVPLASVGTPGSSPRLDLAAGRYRLEVTSRRRNSRVPYRLRVEPEQLLPGMDREVQAPAELELALGEDGLAEIGSFGSADVKARLLDAQGALVAQSDDRPDDWNFQIGGSLAQGRYRLVVEPVAAPNATTTVFLRAPREEERPALALPAGLDLDLGRAALVFPLPAFADELLLARATSRESVGIALEAGQGDVWRVIASASGREARIEARVGGDGASHRLRVWSLDRRGTPARLSLVSASPVASDEAAAQRGVEPGALQGSNRGALTIALDRPGLFRVAGAASATSYCDSRSSGCRPAVNGLVAASTSRLFLVGDPRASVKLERVRLAAGDRLATSLPASGPLVCDLGAGDGPLVVRARSLGRQPGIRIQEVDSSPGPGGPMAVAPGFAAAVALAPRRPAAVAWSATPAPGAGEVRLETTSLPWAESATASFGVIDGTLVGPGARSYALPEGGKRLRLTLGPELIAVVASGSQVESVHAAASGETSETLDTAAPTLVVLHTGSGLGRYSIELGARAEPLRLRPDRPLELTPPRAGTLRLEVEALASGTTLHVRGAAVTFVSRQGRVLRGRDLEIDGPGSLSLPHGTAPLVAWLQGATQSPRDAFGAAQAPEQRVEPPASLPLSGSALALRFERAQPALLQLRSATPLLSVVTTAGGSEVEVHGGGAALDAYLASGATEVLLRPLGGGLLAGELDVTTTPVTPIGEGLSEETLLAPGASRVFSFEVARHGPVGIGVRASADLVEATLLSSSGARLGEGSVQMPTLAPGTYLLVLHAPEDAPPVFARPALAGLEPPSLDPPADVVRRYLQPEEALPQFSSRFVEEISEEEAEAEGELAEEEDPEEHEEEPDPDSVDAGPGGSL